MAPRAVLYALSGNEVVIGVFFFPSGCPKLTIPRWSLVVMSITRFRNMAIEPGDGGRAERELGNSETDSISGSPVVGKRLAVLAVVRSRGDKGGDEEEEEEGGRRRNA